MPSMRAFDFPPSGLAARMNNRITWATSFRGDMAPIPLNQKHCPRGRIVKSRIQTQVVRLGLSRLRTDNGQRVQHERKHRPLIHIGGRAYHAQRHPTPIDQQMVFIARFSAVRGIRPRVFFPP
jgi:hypothetical protein